MAIATIKTLWLARGVLAHVTVTIDDPAKHYTIAWLMGPDGEHCFTPYSLLGETMGIGGDSGIKYPDRCSVSYDEALVFAHWELKDEWL